MEGFVPMRSTTIACVFAALAAFVAVGACLNGCASPAPAPAPASAPVPPVIETRVHIILENDLPPIEVNFPSDARIFGSDGVFLGQLSDPGSESSIANPTGPYGSPDSRWSIFNHGSAYGSFGSERSAMSPSAKSPPVLVWPKSGVKPVAVTRNQSVPGRVDPIALRENIRWRAAKGLLLNSSQMENAR
jgi:hypothetical protein